MARSLEILGHTVTRIQEDTESWRLTVDKARDADLFMWTQTHRFSQMWNPTDALWAIRLLGQMMPTVSFHLDLWWGLSRWQQVLSEPFFRTRYVFTADGDHPEAFADAQVNHFWLPPGVFGPECFRGTPNPDYACKVAFVGSHRGSYHPEWWNQRRALLNMVRQGLRTGLRLFPEQEAIRGKDLNDLYASAKVVIGDSCFSDRSRFYFSDRAFETVGRGGCAVLPAVPALTEMLKDGEHCRFYQKFRDAPSIIDELLRDQAQREHLMTQGQAYVQANHTYAHRMTQMFDVLRSQGAL